MELNFLKILVVNKVFFLKKQFFSFLILTIPHCVKRVRIRSYSGPYFPAFELNTNIQSNYEYSVRVRENTDQNNKDTFYAVLGKFSLDSSQIFPGVF